MDKNSVKLFIQELLRTIDNSHRISPTLKEYSKEATKCSLRDYIMRLLSGNEDERGKTIRKLIPASELDKIIQYIDNHIELRGPETSQAWYGIREFFLPWITAIAVDLLAEL